MAILTAAALWFAVTGPAPALDDARRLEAVSRALLGAPYRLGPLGEEAPPDGDPRFRLDVFDCTTYVETVLALALAEEAAAPPAPELLDRIRYTGAEPTFAKRRHLVDTEWIPELIAGGLLHDVTRDLGGKATRRAVVDLKRRSWERSELARELDLPWSAIPAGRHALPYLPWDTLEDDRIAAELPDAAILNVVVAPDPDVPTLVIHQGLLLRLDGGALVVRHASSLYRGVVEEPLDAFLDHTRARRRRPPLGLNVLSIDLSAWSEPAAAAVP